MKNFSVCVFCGSRSGDNPDYVNQAEKLGTLIAKSNWRLVYGAGWCWLVKDTDGSLKVTKTENGVNPLCFGQTALLGCDVWEHSYYIDFRNKRPAYLTNFLDNLVNWDNVASRL